MALSAKTKNNVFLKKILNWVAIANDFVIDLDIQVLFLALKLNSMLLGHKLHRYIPYSLISIMKFAQRWEIYTHVQKLSPLTTWKRKEYC